MEAKIERNIPVPKAKSVNAQLSELQVGDSFAFSNDKRAYVSFVISAKYHKLTDKRFTVSADPKNPETKSRVWRIADAD